MQKINLKIALIILCCFAVVYGKGQNSEKVIIHTEHCNQLIAGVNNYISIFARQDSVLAVSQISAFLITAYSFDLSPVAPKKLSLEKAYGKFKIYPDSVGQVEFRVKLKDTTVIVSVAVKPLEAVCRLSSYKANSDEQIPAALFKTQIGLIAPIECCGFDAKCRILEFEMIRIAKDGITARVKNIGGRFEKGASRLLDQAKPGDLYIFRNIYYRCPRSKKQRSDDMIFEIK